MSFEDIPEDIEQSYDCEECGCGNIKYNQEEEAWQCDNCDARPK